MPSQVGLEAAQESARLTALALIAGIWQAIGDLDRIAAWATVNGVGLTPILATQIRHSSSIPPPTSSGVFGPDIGARHIAAVELS
jgi:hypothetical protein